MFERLLIWLGSCVVLLTTSCDFFRGDSSGTPANPALSIPVTAVIEADSLTIDEGSQREIEVWVDLTPQVGRANWVRLSLEGTATVNRDYEIDEQTLSFAPNQTRASTKLRVLDDWLEESSERITIRLAEFSPATSAGIPSTIEIAIQDDLDRALDSQRKAEGMVDLFVINDMTFSAETLTLGITVLNKGQRTSSETQIAVTTYEWRRRGEVGRLIEGLQPITVPPLEHLSWIVSEATLDLSAYQPHATYWMRVEVEPSLGEENNVLPNSETLGFTLNAEGDIMVRCEMPDRRSTTGDADPLLEHQWPLRNAGQRAFSNRGGIVGQDLRMSATLNADSPTGRGVNVSIVDTGMEICHPDLAANVVEGGSFNFNAKTAGEPGWHHADRHDPYLPDALGDHGTSVAGIVAAVANNGLGLRGVAPTVRLFGFNYLSEQCCEEDALGGSSLAPNSAQIDVFNMSYGSIGRQYYEPDDTIVSYGTTNLRDGRGAIYVKAAGNGYDRCVNFRHEVHDAVGCSNSNSDSLNNLPYVIVVGAVNANGDKASYSSTGSNLWISAPAGEYGVHQPATVTTDQYGLDRGYGSRNIPGIATDRVADPHGDYFSNFNGTSAATPHVTGVVALLLEEEPNLTWRDVKHVFANTARRPPAGNAAVKDVRVMLGAHLATLSRDWMTNGAGYDFHNDFGFGIVDVDAALTFLRGDFQPDRLGEQIRSDWFESSVGETNIPDHNGQGLVQRLTVDLPARANIEAVQLAIKGSHDNLVDLSIELTSPSGTQSILNSVFNDVLAGNTTLDWQLLSNAFYGESPRGEWTLRIIDAAAEDTGYLTSWALRVWYGEHP